MSHYDQLNLPGQSPFCSLIHFPVNVTTQTVEEASSRATDVAFGLVDDAAITGKKRGKMAAQLRAEQVRNHESAYTEGTTMSSMLVLI